MGSYVRMLIVYRSYLILIEFNGILYTELMIDPHYELKHKGSISDGIIIELILTLHKSFINEQARSIGGYSFYEVDVNVRNKLYRLVLTTPPDHSFLGVRNAYRRSK